MGYCGLLYFSQLCGAVFVCDKCGAVFVCDKYCKESQLPQSTQMHLEWHAMAVGDLRLLLAAAVTSPMPQPWIAIIDALLGNRDRGAPDKRARRRDAGLPGQFRNRA